MKMAFCDSRTMSLRAVFDVFLRVRKFPNHRVARLIDPLDDLNEFVSGENSRLAA
jgi:hypothetical protein